MRITEVEYWVGDDCLESYSGNDIQIPRIGDAVILRCAAGYTRRVKDIIFNAPALSVDVILS